MSRRTRLYNAFESQVAVDLTAGGASVELVSVTGLAAPGRVVIDYRDSTKREWIEFAGISGNTLTGVTRGLPGSSGAGGAVAHAAGALVRSVPMHQHFDDIFSDIEDLEAGVVGHSNAANPHPVYALDGDVAAVQAELDATQVDLGVAQVDIANLEAQAGVNAPVGAIIMWPVAAAPSGWLLCNGFAIPAEYTALIALVGANTPDLRDRFPIGVSDTKLIGTEGGSETKTLTVAQLPSHDHAIPAHAHTFGTRDNSNFGGAAPASGSVAGTNGTMTTGSVAQTTNTRGSGDPFDVMNPWSALNFIIKT